MRKRRNIEILGKSKARLKRKTECRRRSFVWQKPAKTDSCIFYYCDMVLGENDNKNKIKKQKKYYGHIRPKIQTGIRFCIGQIRQSASRPIIQQLGQIGNSRNCNYGVACQRFNSQRLLYK